MAFQSPLYGAFTNDSHRQMAKIEELNGQIADARVRGEIAAEVKQPKARKKFGLVFEERLPGAARHA